MKPIEDLLKNLARAEVLEFGLVTNRLPSVNIGGKFEPVDDEAPTTEKLLQMLVTMGGSRYVEALSDKPVQWTTRLEGVGVIAVAAIMRKDVVQARFTVARRDVPGGRASMPPQPGASPSQAPSQPQQAARPFATTQQGSGRVEQGSAGRLSSAPSPAAGGSAPPAASGGGVAPVVARASAHAPAPQIIVQAPGSQGRQSAVQAAAQTQPQPAKPVPPSQPQVQPAAPAKMTGSAALANAAPQPAPADDWEDDDEPTVQTLSPPVQSPLGGEPRPKPARKPDQVGSVAPAAGVGVVAAAAAALSRDTGPLGSAAPASPAGQAAPRTERGLPPELEERKAETSHAGADRTVVERSPEPARAPPSARVAADVTIEHRPEQRSSERLIEALPAPPPAPSPLPLERTGGPQRINTPTSVDAVDVEITTADTGKKPLVLDLDAEARDATLQVTPAQVAKAKPRPVTASVPSAVPSTSPSAAAPEKDRPRGDGGLEAFLGMAVATRATDLHVIAGRPVLLRVATDLLPRTQPVPAEIVERIAREVVPTRLRETLESEGACDFAIEHLQHGRFRVNVSRQRTGYKLSMRVIPRDMPTLASLGLPLAIAAATTHQQGLVIVTGPAGSGKTTTLTALVDQLNTETAHHILTIEDPVEFVHPRKRALVSQREIGAHARSFASALGAAMREDPDVIVVGELRDAETVRLAVAASETGHLVLATMNTPSAAKTIDRLIDLFPASEQGEIRTSIAGSLRMLVGQRLVPSADRTRLHAAVELLPSSIALYTLIRDGRTYQIPSLQQRGRVLGVLRLDESLADLARAQKATLEVVKQFAESPQDVDALVARGSPSLAPRKG